jgi:hypothetical protein
MEFDLHDLIFIASESRRDCMATASLQEMQTDVSKQHKLVQFLQPETYQRFISQLKQTYLLASPTTSPHLQSRNDLLHIEVYQYLDAFLKDNCSRLPYGFRESLELDCNELII